MMGIIVSLIAVFTVAFINAGYAQVGAADARRGQQLATRLCSGCHIVTAGSTATANADIPTFPAIADRPDTTPERLAGRIIIPHPPMPTTQLTVAEMRDVIAYIMSLKRQP